MISNQLIALIGILTAWSIFNIIAKRLDLEKRGWEVHPLYALIKSKKLNNLIFSFAKVNPVFWRIFGNIAVASSLGQATFVSYILIQNLWNFIFRPENASPVQPLIPGVTISISSLPWFLAATGIVIFAHELSHGIQCAVEGIPIKNSALLIAVITIGGAVEPDEEAIQEASNMAKMRIFASGGFMNLLIGLITIPIFIISNLVNAIQITKVIYQLIQIIIAIGILVTSFLLIISVISLLYTKNNSIYSIKSKDKYRNLLNLILLDIILFAISITFLVIIDMKLIQALNIFLNWIYFISINLAMINMLPLGPLDGGVMWRTWTNTQENSRILQKIANYGFITLIGGNMILSLAQFGLIPI
jgi:membrane-associated protease RseP (regulator of RpoE activity)